MTNGTWLGAAVFALALVAAITLASRLLGGGGDTSASAQEVLDQAAQAQTELLASIKSDSTLHVVWTEYDPAHAILERKPGWDPVNTKKEWWTFFDHTGNITAFRAESTDLDTGELYRVVEWQDGALVTTYSATGETARLPFTWSVDALRQQIIKATNAGLNTVAADGTLRVGVAQGRAAYVIERPRSEGGTQRISIDKDSYRPLQVDFFDDAGNLEDSQAMPVWEFLSGDQAPGTPPSTPLPMGTSVSLATAEARGAQHP